MSYDIYCYPSQLGTPDLDEALEAIEINEDQEMASDPETKLKLAKALMDFDPQLKCAELNGEEIARLLQNGIEKDKEPFDHIELNTQEGHLTLQLHIFDNNVAISAPYWHTGDNANEIFTRIAAYAKIIRQTAGYFVYDPQTEQVFDPLTDNIFEIKVYKNVTELLGHGGNEPIQKSNKKPWWKFW